MERKRREGLYKNIVAIVYMILIYLFFMYFCGPIISKKVAEYIGDSMISNNGISNIVAIIINIIIIIVFYFGNKKNKWFLLQPLQKISSRKSSILLIMFATILYGHLSMIITNIFISLLGIQTPTETEININGSNAEIMISFIAIVLICPIAEEYVFRKNIYGKLRMSISFKKATVVSAIIWGCLHGSFYLGINAFIMGLLFASIYEKSHTLKLLIVLHMTINFMSVLPLISGFTNHVYYSFMNQIYMMYPVIFLCVEIYLCYILLKKYLLSIKS